MKERTKHCFWGCFFKLLLFGGSNRIYERLLPLAAELYHVSWYGRGSKRWTCWPWCRRRAGLVGRNLSPSWRYQPGTSDPRLVPDRTADPLNPPEMQTSTVNEVRTPIQNCKRQFSHTSNNQSTGGISPYRRPSRQRGPRHTPCVATQGRSSSCNPSDSVWKPLLSAGLREAPCLQGGKPWTWFMLIKRVSSSQTVMQRQI